MRIDERIAAGGEPSFSFEFFPPRTADGERNLDEALAALARLDPTFVSVTYGAGGSAEQRGRTISWYATTHQRLAADTRPAPDDSHLRVVERCERVDLLLLDDFAATRITEWGGDVLLGIIDTRWAACKPCIITTNVAAGPLDETIGPRVASRLRDAVRVGFTGPDLRGAR